MTKNLNFDQSFSLYIHIPFCQSKCNYCDFYSIKYKEKSLSKYLDALQKELQLYAKNIENNKINTIYFGGGTPNLLNSKQLEEILNTIEQNYSIKNKAEITIESNPESVNEKKVKKYKKLGISRVSLGVQSFVDQELKFLGRTHNTELSLKAIETIKKHYNNYNLDIIFAIPGQSYKNFILTLNKLIEIAPPHVSLYNLQIEPKTKLYKMLKNNEIKKISEELDFKMYNKAIYKLKSKGYKHYEISNFAKKGHRSKHNVTYWKYKPYLGIGASAHGFNGYNRYYNICGLRDYVKSLKDEKFPIDKVVKLSKKELISEKMIMGLRLIEGIDKKEFEKRFKIPVDEVYKTTINKLKKQNLIRETEQKIFLTKKGLNLGNITFAEFLL